MIKKFQSVWEKIPENCRRDFLTHTVDNVKVMSNLRKQLTVDAVYDFFNVKISVFVPDTA